MNGRSSLDLEQIAHAVRRGHRSYLLRVLAAIGVCTVISLVLLVTSIGARDTVTAARTSGNEETSTASGDTVAVTTGAPASIVTVTATETQTITNTEITGEVTTVIETTTVAGAAGVTTQTVLETQTVPETQTVLETQTAFVTETDFESTTLTVTITVTSTAVCGPVPCPY